MFAIVLRFSGAYFRQALSETSRSESVKSDEVALILVGLGTLAVMELKTPPRTTKPVNEPPAQATVGLRALHDTLTTADRLETPHMQFEAPPQPVSSSEPMPPPDQTAIVAQEPLKIIEQHKRSESGEKSAVMLPRPG
jgi:hypothetical protein